MKSNFSIFDFQELPVRLALVNDQPWFVAADVCRILDISNSRDAVSSLDDDEKNTVVITDGNRGNPNTTIVSESGLYALIFKSRKTQAKKFRKWVTSEVLPTIRQQGRYEMESDMQASERGQLAQLRKLLLQTAQGVVTHAVSIGQAQAVSLSAQRYLESIKLEGEAQGYENVFGLRNAKAVDGFLPKRPPGDGSMQGLPQSALQGAEAGESAVSSEASGMQGALATGESEAGSGLSEEEQAEGADHLSRRQGPGGTDDNGSGAAGAS